METAIVEPSYSFISDGVSQALTGYIGQIDTPETRERIRSTLHAQISMMMPTPVSDITVTLNSGGDTVNANGDSYSPQAGRIVGDVRVSADGTTWIDTGEENPVVYTSGYSQVVGSQSAINPFTWTYSNPLEDRITELEAKLAKLTTAVEQAKAPKDNPLNGADDRAIDA